MSCNDEILTLVQMEMVLIPSSAATALAAITQEEMI